MPFVSLFHHLFSSQALEPLVSTGTHDDWMKQCQEILPTSVIERNSLHLRDGTQLSVFRLALSMGYARFSQLLSVYCVIQDWKKEHAFNYVKAPGGKLKTQQAGEAQQITWQLRNT
jgi:hypothetical protein